MLIFYLLIPLAFYLICYQFFKGVKQKRDSQRAKDIADSPAQQSLVQYPCKCPYCGDGEGEMPAGIYCCSQCQRTFVFHRMPTEEEAETIKKEEVDVNRIFEPDFNLMQIREAILNAFMTRVKPEYFIKFSDTHADLMCGMDIEQNRQVVSYPKLETPAGIQALTHQCMIYVRGQDPYNEGNSYFEGHGFFNCK